MEAAAARIVGRALTEEERQILIHLREQYGYDDGDPVVVVLSMFGAIKIIADEIPSRIKAASEAVIEMHITGLREQSMLVAREVVGHVAGLIHAAGRSRKGRLIDMAVGGVFGALVAALVVTMALRHNF